MARVMGNRIVAQYLRQRRYPTVDAEAIYQGDIMIKNSGAATVSPSSKLTTMDAIADAFVGIAAQSKQANEVKDIMVGVDCVADLDLASAVSGTAGKVGDLVGAYVTGGAGVPQSITLGGTASTDPIGKLAKAAAIGDTVARVHCVGIDVRGPSVAD